MSKNAVLGGLTTAMVGVVGYLLYSSGVIGNKNVNYSPSAQNGYYNQGPVPQGQSMPQGQPVQQGQPMAQAQPVQQAPMAQAVASIAPKQVASNPPPAAPAPALVQTQDMVQLIALLNMFGNPSGPDQELGCYIQVQQNNGGTWIDLALVNEECVATPYDANSVKILSRKNGEAFFNLYGGSYSLVRVDSNYPDINFYQPRSAGFSFSSNVGPGPTPACMVADNSTPSNSNTIRVTVCVQ